jgi:hypothetical protein
MKVSRHDDVAHERQQKLALLLCLSDLFVALAAAAIALRYHWHSDVSGYEIVLGACLTAISWVTLLVAGGTVGWVASLFSALSSAPTTSAERVDAVLLARYRMAFYYVGVFCNLAVIALITEVTGGIGGSPFVPLLIAFVLTSQQLSRFRTQSGLMLLSGLIITVLLLLVEPLATEPATAPPKLLTIVMLMLAFATGALLTYFEKPHNLYVEKHVHKPSRVRIYRDGKGSWRAALYDQVHQQDPVLMCEPECLELSSGAFPDGLKKRVEDYVAVMADAAGWSRPTMEWPKTCSMSFAMLLSFDEEGGR